MARPTWLLAALVAIPMSAAVGQEAAPAETPAANTTPEQAPAQSRRDIGEALREPAEVTLSPGQKLGEVVRGLTERHGVRIDFGKPELAERSLDRLRNEMSFRGIPLQAALSFAVQEAGLSWDFRDGSLLIQETRVLRAAPADRIRAALREETQLEFPQTPLRDAVQFLADLHDINIVIDEQEATDAGVNVDDNVDIVLTGIRLGDALNLLLKPYGLTYVTANDVLMVTTEARAAREIDTRSYDVSAIVGEAGYATEAAEVVNELLEPRSTLANAMIAATGKPPVPLPQPRIVPFKQQLLVTASWADQRRVEEILRLIEGGRE